MDENVLEFKTNFGSVMKVRLEVGSYQNNDSLYVSLITVEEELEEPYGNLTVNLPYEVPRYCAFLDINNIPESEQFVAENEIAFFTGYMLRSGYCVYPLYRFDKEKLKSYCPNGTKLYEIGIGLLKNGNKEGFAYEEAAESNIDNDNVGNIGGRHRICKTKR